MRINKKRLKHLVRRPRIRPRIVNSLTRFDENINQEQNAKLIAKRHNSDTIDLLRFLIAKMDDSHRFDLPKRLISQHFLFNQPSLNFNFAALHQLKMIRVDWNYFKTTDNVRGQINTQTVF